MIKTAGDAMSHDVYLVKPEQTLAEAAMLMRDADVGSLAVMQDDKLTGMLTDRDIVTRGVAGNLGPQTRVQDVMTDVVRYCFDDDSIEDVALNMAELQIRRMPVVNHDKRLVGFIALSNISEAADPQSSHALLQTVAVPHD